ncbi:MAG: sulfite exporter TauE/SafE family protein, partial [Gemmatimonadota bacterium]|nr:sulfite exporter TauE/SafE family protein [Gemmatimonadota bacterium]
MGEALRGAILDWYIFLSSLSAPVTTGVLSLEQRVGIPLISALLLGVIGAAAPCQLSQSIGMLAVLGAEQTGRSRWRATLAYVAGKGLVYSALGILVVAAGASFSL